jgi:hypothetical protein
MYDSLNRILLEHGPRHFAVVKVALDKKSALVNRLSMPLREIIKYDNLVTAFEQLFDDDGADIPGSACY